MRQEIFLGRYNVGDRVDLGSIILWEHGDFEVIGVGLSEEVRGEG